MSLRGKYPLILAFTLILVATGLIVWLTNDGLQEHKACPPTFDEAVHLLPVMQVSRQIRQLDVISFLKSSYTQDEIAGYPFFHSWVTTPFFLVLPASLTLGRLVNILLVALSIVMAFLIANELSPSQDTGWLAALVAAGLVMTALPLWAFASRVFLEPLGLLLTLGVLFCYTKAAPPDTKGRLWLLSTSFLTALALFTKYSFGLFLLGTLILTEAILWLSRRKGSSRRWFYLFGPFALLALLWFASADKLQILWTYSRSQDATLPLWSLESLTFYLQSLAQVYALGWLAIGLVLLGFTYAIFHGREHRYRVILIYLLVSFVSLTLVGQKDQRFAYTVAPIALLLAGVGAAWIFDYFYKQKHYRFRRYGVLIVLIILLAMGTYSAIRRFSYLQAAQEVVYKCPPENVRQAYGFVLENSLLRGKKPYILNEWHRFNQYGLVWLYATNSIPPQEIATFDLTSGGLAPAPTKEGLRKFIANLREQGVGVLVSIDGSPAGDHTGWQIVEPLWDQGELEWLESSEPYQIITWSDEYATRALGGNFRDQYDFETAREDGLENFEIQLHLYEISPRKSP